MWTALHVACKKGDIDSVRLLLERKADPLRLTKAKFNTLYIAVGRLQLVAAVSADLLCFASAQAEYGHAAIVKLLLETRAASLLDFKCGKAEWSPLHVGQRTS